MFGKMSDDYEDDDSGEEHSTETRTVTRHKKTGKIVSNKKHVGPMTNGRTGDAEHTKKMGANGRATPPHGEIGPSNANPLKKAAERKGPANRMNGLPSPAAAKAGGTPPAKKSAFGGGKASGSKAKKDGVAALKAKLRSRSTSI
jgi:hypothetical protein